MPRWPLVGVVLIASLAATPVGAQPPPLSPTRDRGQGVTPVFEGWYRNADGTFSLSFGYFNRNAAEVLEIPLLDEEPRGIGRLERIAEAGLRTASAPAATAGGR